MAGLSACCATLTGGHVQRVAGALEDLLDLILVGTFGENGGRRRGDALLRGAALLTVGLHHAAQVR